MTQPTGEDVRRAAASFTGLLVSGTARDWSTCAGELTWTASEVVAHVADVCGFYAIHLAPSSHRRLRFDVALHPTASVADRAATIGALAAHLAQVIDTAPADARAWHHWGMADSCGFAAMACDELLVHGRDIADGWAIPFEPDRDLCARVLARLFPWAPPTVDPWDALRWANGRIALPDPSAAIERLGLAQRPAIRVGRTAPHLGGGTRQLHMGQDDTALAADRDNTMIVVGTTREESLCKHRTGPAP